MKLLHAKQSVLARGRCVTNSVGVEGSRDQENRPTEMLLRWSSPSQDKCGFLVTPTLGLRSPGRRQQEKFDSLQKVEQDGPFSKVTMAVVPQGSLPSVLKIAA